MNSEDERIEKMKEILEQTLKAMEELEQNHNDLVSTVNLQSNAINILRANLIEMTEKMKKDREKTLDSFQKILNSALEGIRNEIIIVGKKLEVSYQSFLEEARIKYFPAENGRRMEEQLSHLEQQVKELQDSFQIRFRAALDQLVKDAEEAINNELTILDKKIKELELLKSDLESLIERRVNEKFDQVFAILAQIAGESSQILSIVKARPLEPLQNVEKKLPKLPSDLGSEP